MASHENVTRRNATRDRGRRPERAADASPDAADRERLAPMQWGRGNPWVNAYQGKFGQEPHYAGYGEYGWGAGGGLFEVIYPPGALRSSHAGKGPRGYTRSDERIAEEIVDRLTWHSAIDASDIEVRVARGEATLTGAVESRFAKRLAGDVANDVRGVHDVHNRLEIRPHPGW